LAFSPVIMKSSIFWDVTPCSPLKFLPSVFKLVSCFAYSYTVKIESTFRNVGWFSTGYTVLYLRIENSSIRKCSSLLDVCSSLKIEAECSSETLLNVYKTSWHNSPRRQCT
jgi:hypothetical protein